LFVVFFPECTEYVGWLTRADKENKLLREVEFTPNLALDGTVSRLIDEEADISSSRTIPLEIPT
jgi:hypothetical protein